MSFGDGCFEDAPRYAELERPEYPDLRNDGIQSGDFLERMHRPPDGPFWRPIFRSWLIWGGGVFWVLIAAKIVRFVAGVFL